jgi:hypothetical protein
LDASTLTSPTILLVLPTLRRTLVQEPFLGGGFVFIRAILDELASEVLERNVPVSSESLTVQVLKGSGS